MTDLSQLSDQELEATIGQLEQQLGPQVTPGEGAPASTRAAASFKSTPEERLAYFQKALGPENVSQDQSGGLIWRKPGEEAWHAVDEPGFSLADIADFAGDVPEMLGAGLGAAVGAGGGTILAPGPGTVAGGVKGAALGGAAGNVIKQLISAFLPGEEKARPVERVADVATAGALSAGGQWVGGKIAQKLASRAAAKGSASAYEQEGQRILQEMGQGVPPDIAPSLTAAQMSGNQGLRILEDMNRRNFLAAQIYGQRELQNQIKPVLHRTEQIMNKLVASEVPDVDLGMALKQTFERATNLLQNAMYDNAAKNFAFLDFSTGGLPIIPIRNFQSTLNLLSQNAGRPGSTAAQKALAGQAADLLEDISRAAPQGVATAADVQRWLSTYGRRAYQGTGGNIFRDIDTMSDRAFAKDFYKSLMQDLDAAANATTTLPAIPGVKGQNVARLLKQARDTFRVDREAITELERSVLGRKLGKDIPLESVERLAEWARKLRPPELSAAMSILEVSRPNIRQLTARNFIENALSKAKLSAEESTQTLAQAPISMNVLLKYLPDEPTMQAIMGAGGKDVAANLKVVEDFLRRAIQRTESTYSLQNVGIFQRALTALHNPSITPKLALSYFFPRATAEMLTDPAANEAFRTVRHAGGRLSAKSMNILGKVFERALAPAAVAGQPEY